MKSKKTLINKYKLSEEELDKLIYKCFAHHLSEDELKVFIDEYYFKLEMRINKRCQV